MGLHLPKDVVQGTCAVKRTGQYQVRQVRLVFECVGLRQHAAERVSDQVDASQIERLPDRLDVFDHGFDGVSGRVLELFRLARSAFVDEEHTVRARQWQQVREEVGVRGAGSTVQDHQWCAVAQGLVVDENAMGVYETGFEFQDRP